MKLQIVSDTHNHFFEIDETADVIVHAGDVGNNGIYYLLDFAKRCNDLKKQYVIALGNHDLYSSNYQGIFKSLDALNIKYLTDGKEIKIGSHTFVGGTLFSNFRSNKLLYEDPYQLDLNKDNAEKFIYDFQCIGYNSNLITANNYITEFNKQWNWIQKYKDRDDVIVVTHFPPNLVCLSDYWRDHPTDHILNSFFVNDMPLTGFKTWISDHVHHAVDTVVDGCRMIVNPLGYPQEQNLNGFIPNMIIEV